MIMRMLSVITLIFLFPIWGVAEDIVFATGDKTGTYFSISKGIVRAVKKNYPELNFLILNTRGAIENARLIDTDACDIALIQNDVAYYFKKGKEIFRFPSNKMQGIASLYTEPIQIIVRKNSEIEELRDLRGKVVAVGPKESGTEFNTKIFLNAIGINYEDIEERFLDISQAKDSFINNDIDAMFITAGLPTPGIIEIAKRKEIAFLQISIKLIREIRKDYPFFVSTFIPANTYPNQYIEIPTLGVRTLLVAHQKLNPDLVRNITQAIFKEKDILESAHPIGKSINLKKTLKGMTIPIHMGAREYYVEKKILEVKFIDHLIRIVPLLAIVTIILLLIIKFFYAIKHSFKRHVVVRIILILGGVYIVGTIGLYFCEHKVNESFGSLGTSFWSVLVYMLSGFEGRSPITTIGKAIAIYIFIIGLAILGLITGKIASVFVMEKLKGGKMPKEIKGHIVICNWNNRGDRIIKEIHQAEPKLEITVITNNEVNEDELRKSKEYKNVFFGRGDPSIHDVLEAARVHLAQSVIILADEKAENPDAESALTALAITKVCEEIKKESKKVIKPHIVAEALNHRKITHLKDAGADEVICAEDYGLGILAQSALYEKLSEVYHCLLSYGGETNEIYIVESPRFSEKFIGKSFDKASDLLDKNRDPKNPSILLGVKRDEQIILNPQKGEFDEIKEGDALIVMAYDSPDLRNIE